MDHQTNEDSIKLVLEFPRKMNQCVRTYASTYLKETRIKPQYLLLIYHIGCNDGISQKVLNENVPFDKSYISTMVRDLMDLGLVQNDSVGKLHKLRLTPQGRDVFAMSKMMFDLLDRSLFDVLTEEEKEVLGRIMRKLDARLDHLMDEFARTGTDS